ncbi:conserved hypothetical protein [Frankia canadensis]|uniref:Uncharacterized protein n=1 Tax=Frankia canadensis TaxID=1836972 RepID=A0A2I2L2L8_9ACTN|nr:conserved hypothetical protein [Frankia canadensis]SOU59454.1 conserved hypothetical protein [Frankia canadensis]
MSLTPPVLLLSLAFPLLIMAGMLLMGGVERRLTDSRARLALVPRETVAAEAMPVAATPVEHPQPGPRPTLSGPFFADVATTPLRFPARSVANSVGREAERGLGARRGPAPVTATATATATAELSAVRARSIRTTLSSPTSPATMSPNVTSAAVLPFTTGGTTRSKASTPPFAN